MTEDLICDYCSGKPVVWRYIVFPLPIVVETPVGMLTGSRDDWAACATCKVLIDAGDRQGLLDRAIATYPHRLQHEVEIRLSVKNFHDQFFDLLNGDGSAHRRTPTTSMTNSGRQSLSVERSLS